MNHDVFEKYPVHKAVFTLALPTMMSMLVTIIYNMADTFFVGQTKDPNQVAAVSLTMPVFLLCMAFGNMFGIGGSSMISRLMGEGKKDRVKKVSSFCFYGCIVVGILLMVFFLLAMPVVLKLIGTSSNTEGYARDYLTYIAYGAIFVVLSNAFGNIVRAEGAAKASMFGMMLGTIVNIVLDPIMILAMNMGVAGAAIATIIGNICTVIFYIWYLVNKNSQSLLSIHKKDFSMSPDIVRGVLGIGVPASINNILMSMANILLNNFLASYGDIPVAAMGVASKANMLVVMLQLGLAMGIQPLIGYSYGSRNFKRMRSVMKFSMICNVILGSILTFIYFCFTEQIVQVFIQDSSVTQLGSQMLRALMVSGPILGILFVFNFTFQALGKALPALVLSLSRQGLIFLPVLVISNRLFQLDGIIWAQPIADIMSTLIAFCMFLIINKGFKKLEEAA